MRVMVKLKEVWSSTVWVEADSPEQAKKFFEAMSVEKFQEFTDGDLDHIVEAEPTPFGMPSIDISKIVGIEAVCTKCDETFNPHGFDDLIHTVRQDPTGEHPESEGEECGGQGEITGWWK